MLRVEEHHGTKTTLPGLHLAHSNPYQTVTLVVAVHVVKFC